MDKDKIIYELWKLLDDIDTMDDIARENNKWFRDACFKLQQQRHKIINEKFVEELYDKYYPKEDEPREVKP